MKRPLLLLVCSLICLLAVTLMTGCGTGDDGAVVIRDPFVPVTPTGPSVVAVSPAYGASLVPVTAPISVRFNRQMNPATINASTFFVTGPFGNIPGTIFYDPATLTATFVPTVPLLPGTLYTLRVTRGVADISGFPLTHEFNSVFTTL